MVRKLLVSLSLIGIAFAGSASLALWLIRTKPPPVRRETPPSRLRVEVHTIVPQNVQEKLVGYGTARPDETATLGAQVTGKIVEVAPGLEDGCEVKKDQLLLRIQEDDYRFQLERARNLITSDQATLEQIKLERANLQALIRSAEQEVKIAQEEYSRVSRLFESEAAAKREFDLVRSALLRVTRELDNLRTQQAVLGPKEQQVLASKAAHEAEAGLAALNLERCRIVAPFNGRLKQRMVEVGESVQPGKPLVLLLRLDRIEVPIELPAAGASKVSVGNECVLTVESMPGEQWIGRLERLGPAADERSRTFTAYVVVDNTRESKMLLPGLFVRAEVGGPVHENALVVPRGAVRDGAVFVAADGVARKRPVELACTLRDLAVIAKGVQPGDDVIVTNLAGLADAMPVEVHAASRLANRRENASPTRRENGTP